MKIERLLEFPVVHLQKRIVPRRNSKMRLQLLFFSILLVWCGRPPIISPVVNQVTYKSGFHDGAFGPTIYWSQDNNLHIYLDAMAPYPLEYMSPSSNPSDVVFQLLPDYWPLSGISFYGTDLTANAVINTPPSEHPVIAIQTDGTVRVLGVQPGHAYRAQWP
jgi:hypothetical protein